MTETATLDNIIGIMYSITRKGHTWKTDGMLWRTYSWIWSTLTPCAAILSDYGAG